tara:strand:- start:483 stop:671 length:189 start_codon:yes stop_codon:yes gene_type:complete
MTFLQNAKHKRLQMLLDKGYLIYHQPKDQKLIVDLKQTQQNSIFQIKAQYQTEHSTVLIKTM